MADEVARLVAVLEANTKSFTKGLEDAKKVADRQFGQIERRLSQTERRFSAGFKDARGLAGGLNTALGGLIARYTSWSAILIATQRIVRQSIEVNDDAAKSWERLQETLDKLAFIAGPAVASFFDGLNEIIKRDISDLEKLTALWERLKNLVKGGVTIPLGVSPLAPGFNKTSTIDQRTKNVIPAPGGFPVPGVTDVTPKKTRGKTVAEREAELSLETARRVEEAIGDLIEKQSKENNEFRAKQYEEARELRNSASADELDALDQFHADATAAWDNYYEHLHEAIEEQLRLEEQANDTRRDNLRDTFGEISTLTRSSSNELRAIGKAAAIAQATIDGILAVQKALASAPPPFNFALAALVGAATAANVAEIAGMERGGRVSAGTPYIVGERRPELFVPDTSGTIVPRVPNIADAQGGSGGITVMVNQNMSLSANGDAALADVARRGALDGANMAVRTIERRFPAMMVRAQRDSL